MSSGRLGRAAIVGDEVDRAEAAERLRVAELDGLRVARVLLIPAQADDIMTLLMRDQPHE